MRGIVKLDLDPHHHDGRGRWQPDPEHGLGVIVEFRAGHVLHVVAQVDGEFPADVLGLIIQPGGPGSAEQ